MEQTLLPVGLRRDGSLYTRIEWASHTESDPKLWVVNVIRDDNRRNGGTWGANTMGPANVVLSFFGEEQTVAKIRIFRNVGVDISVLEELAKTIRIYVSNTNEPEALRTAEDAVDSVPWTLVKTVETEKAEGWQEVVLDAPVQAKYVRFELVENHGTPPEIPWTEINEFKIYPLA